MGDLGKMIMVWFRGCMFDSVEEYTPGHVKFKFWRSFMYVVMCVSLAVNCYLVVRVWTLGEEVVELRHYKDEECVVKPIDNSIRTHGKNASPRLIQ